MIEWNQENVVKIDVMQYIEVEHSMLKSMYKGWGLMKVDGTQYNVILCGKWKG